MAMRANDLPAAMQADMQVQGFLDDFKKSVYGTDAWLIKAIEEGRPAEEGQPAHPSYLEKTRNVEALLTKFPKVQASDLGKKFYALQDFLYQTLKRARTGDTSNNPLSENSPRALQKKLWANFLEMNTIESKILSTASELNDTGVQLAPEVIEALKNAATPDGKKPEDKINWWLWGGVGGGVLLLGGLLWWKASKIGKQAPVQGLGRMSGGRKFRSRKNSR